MVSGRRAVYTCVPLCVHVRMRARERERGRERDGHMRMVGERSMVRVQFLLLAWCIVQCEFLFFLVIILIIKMFP